MGGGSDCIFCVPDEIAVSGSDGWGWLSDSGGDALVLIPESELRLMPVNQRYPLESLKEALRQYPLARGNALFMEYVLIKGVNDDPQCAAALAAFFRGLNVKLNLIAYNPNSGSPFEAPTEADLERFHQALVDQRIFVRRRSSKGAGILAACGQLGGGL